MEEEAISSSSLVSGWAWLSSELLDLIVEKLKAISDYVRFGAVCKHWQSVALHQKNRRLKSCHRQLPMLLIRRDNTTSGPLHSVTEDKTYSSVLQYFPDDNKKYSFCGSSHGWLAYVDGDYVITLFNPFTRRTISLPRVVDPNDYEAMFEKLVLSVDPSLFPDDYEALITCSLDADFTRIAHFKSGDHKWNGIAFQWDFISVIYYQGQFLFLTENWDEDIFLRDSSDNLWPNFEPHINMNFRLKVPNNDYFKSSLVESSGGDLLLVRGFYLKSWRHEFQVFKLLRDSEDPDSRPEWVEVKSIGSDALFLGENESMCVSALDFSGCQPNSIYFKVDGVVGVFSLEDKKLVTKPLASASWILPTMV